MPERAESFAFDVLTFPSSHYALKAEKTCKDAGICVALIPLPREISADCGVSIIVRPEIRREAEMLLEEKGVPLDGVHRIMREGREARTWKRLLNA
ncbi:MAG: DUF3343 domain-containing protein [Thermacetogeniaceae bacterium]|jgi:hypothetical protein|nr:DUF3343 domain-containing protein [Syntrophomonadaceae bacterium]